MGQGTAARYDRDVHLGRTTVGFLMPPELPTNGWAIEKEGKAMGLFDFVKEMGEKLFGGTDEAAAAIQTHIEKNNPGIEGLKVKFADGVATISGTAASSEAMEKAVLMAGNVHGVNEVKIQGLDVASGQVEGLKVEYYVIEKGDTLSKIAKQFYGDANKYPQIFEANREVIRDPDLIYPGQKIRIPISQERA